MTKHTPGPWLCGHFADDAHSYNCTSILAEGYMGSIAQVTVGNGLPISQGGNDAPPLEEAKANGRLIAAAPEMLACLKEAVAVTERDLQIGGRLSDQGRASFQRAKDIIARAEGTAPEQREPKDG